MTSFNLPPAVHALKTDKGNWRTRFHQLKIAGIHGGIDPNFRAAVRDLYFRELRKQLNAIDRFQADADQKPVRARLHLLRSLRTSPLIRFSQSHWIELNHHHTELLQEIYRRVDAIKDARRSAFSLRNPESIQESLGQLDRVPTFRLMHRLGQEGLKRTA